ncbi:MAG: hypothetical protein A2457_01975 [Candidatus Yanofskybacteria bacterium RIFOXYC2_FULL_44_13]|nr:MAG: hypothetical protein A2457_01975 [Candidatus Yanofskybacteria bacterium RIFOXYC2_FULL_44_13]
MRKYLLVSALVMMMVCLFVFPFNIANVSAAACTLTNVTWAKANAKIGDDVGYKIDAKDCPLETVKVEVWRDIAGGADAKEAEFSVYLPQGGAYFSSSWRVVSSSVFSEANFYLVAKNSSAGTGASVSSVDTGTIKYLTVTRIASLNPDITITTFDITPKSIPQNGVSKLSVTFKAKADSPAYLITRCPAVQALMIDDAGKAIYSQDPKSVSVTNPNYSFDFDYNYSAGGPGVVNLRGKLVCAGGVFSTLPISSPVAITIGTGGTGSATCGVPGKPACAAGTDKSYPFRVPNWLSGEPQSLTDLLDTLARWLMNIAIPIAVLLIIYSGLIYVTSRGDPKKVTQAQGILRAVVIGLVIIFIGKGFISLIRSILELGVSS